MVEGRCHNQFCSLLGLAVETSNKRLDLALGNKSRSSCPPGTRAGLAAPTEGARLGAEMIPWRDGSGRGGGWGSASSGARVENSPLAGTRLEKSEGPPLAPASLNAGSLG